MNEKTFSVRKIAGFALVLLLAGGAQATPEILDWDGLTWTPPGNGNLSESYTTGSGDFTVTFGGNTADLDQAGGDISPDINQLNTGGLIPAQNGLYVATDYTDNTNPLVTITIDFTGYPGGVGNVSFDVFDMDNGGTFIDDMSVTANTLTGTIDPTSIVTSPSNAQVNSNTVQGTAGSGSTSSDANVTWVFGDGGTPVSGITQINIVWRNLIGTPDPGFQWINIHDVNFDDPMADISLTKGVDLTSAEAGDTVVFTLDVANAGPDVAPGVEITDQLPAGFTYLTDNSGGAYTPGTGIWDVGTVASGGTAQIMIDARMEATGPWDNIAEATQILATDTDSTPDNNVPTEDDQDNAVVTLLVPEIGAAKDISAGPTNNGDGTYTLTYAITVENSGDTAISSLQVVDDLATTFSGATGFVVDSVTSADFAVNPGYDGNGDTALLAGSDTLATATTGTIALTVTVTPGASTGPFNNTATVGGLSPFGTPQSDDSTDGVDPDPDNDGPGNNSVPTPVSFAESPEIGTAKLVVAAPVNNGDGTYTLTYRITVENSGDVPLSGVQIIDDLAATFAGTTGFAVDSVTSGDFTANPGYDGNGDTNVLTGADALATGASGTVDVTVTVDAGGALGPFNNTATASGTSPASTGVSDDSTTGSDPDPENDGPGDNSVPTPISFVENPQIGVAKAITAGPANNGDGTHTLTYTFTLENFGDVPLNSLQVVDNLASTFSGATGFVVDSVTSSDFTANPGFDGSGDTNVLTGADGGFAVGATGTVAVTVTVTPGGTLGPYDNSVFAQGRSPATALTLDNSVDGLDPDPDANGDPVDNASPTPVTFGENPEIGAAKLVVAAPVNNGDGTYTLTYRITVENSGDVPLSGVQIVDDLAATFAGTTGFAVDSVTSGDFTANPGYDGNGDTNVLTGADALATGASGTVDVTVTVDAGGALGPFNNTATASGTSPASTGVSDDSTTGSDPDPENDGPGDNSVPTPISFVENPQIGVAKAITAGPVNNGDGTHTLTYTFTLENFGDVPLNSLQVVDNLASTFSGATGFVVDSVTSSDFTANPGFDGNGDTNVLTGTDGGFAVGATGTVAVTVTVTPGGTLGPYDNSVFAQGRSPATALTLDNSVDGLDPDPDANGDPVDNASPTPVTFGENPEIGAAKLVVAAPVNNGDGTYTLTYRITVENSGDVPLSGVQIVDDLAATFAGTTGFAVDSVTSGDFTANPGYDGNGDTNVLTGADALATGASGTVDVTVTVDAGGALGPFNNTATASGTSPASTGVSDDSTTGSDPDPENDGPGDNSVPTPISFVENPQIGAAKLVVAAPVNNGDGTYTLTYRITVENSGDVPLSGVQIVDDLAATFAGTTGVVVDSVTSSDFTANPGYDGNGDTNVLTGADALATGASGTVDVTVTVDAGGALGPFNNTATASGTSPASTGVSDDSTTGSDPDPDNDGPGNNAVPTPVSFAESPQIGLAKAITAGPANNGDGTHTLTYTFTLENFGDVPLNSLQVVDNLAATFSGATGFVVDSVTSSDFTANPGFDGNGDTNVLTGTDGGFAVGATGTVAVTVTVTPGGTLGPYDNSAFAQGRSPASSLTLDNSVNGLDPDPDANGDPVDNAGPTPVTFGENPQIGVAKAITAGPANNGDGTHTLTYTFTLENFGDVPLNSLQVVDNLASTFSGATGFVVDSVTSSDFTPNPGFDGNGDTNVLAGTDGGFAVAATGTVEVTVTVTPGGALGPYDNAAFAQAQSPALTLTLDNSVDGLDPDPDANDDPVDNVGPTPVTFSESPEIGTAKLVVAAPVNNGDGTYTLTYRITVENSGDVPLSGVQIVDDLAATFAGTTGFTVDSVTSGDFTANPGYDGNGDTNVLTGADALAAGATGTVEVTVTVDAGGALGPFNNTATASGTSPASTAVSDDSTTGSDPDPDNDGPGNNAVPTPVSFAESPQIGVAKAITAGPVNNGDGTHTLTYTFTLENFGDVPLNSLQVVDNLASTFSGATGFLVDSVISSDFTVNAGFDGTGDTNVLAGTDGGFAVGATGTVEITVTVTPGGTLGPYDNTVFAQGSSPGSVLTLDNSVEGLDPDPDANGDPVDNAGPTPVTFVENPLIGIAKSVSSGPVSNGDGTFTLTYTMTVENFGDVPLNNVQVVDDLTATFAGTISVTVDSVTSGDFAPNPGYDGDGDTNILTGADALATGASGTIDVMLTVDAGGTLGPFDNTATANGVSPSAAGVSDVSQSGANPDPDSNGDPNDNSDPTPVSFAEMPQIGVAKSVNTPVNNGDGTFTLEYTITVENSGDVPLGVTQVTDDLAAAYAAAAGFTVDSVTSADFTVNPAYDGDADTNLLDGTDVIVAGASGAITLTVTVTPGGNSGPYDNTAVASAETPSGTPVSDLSTTGADPDPGNDGPGDDMTPTPVSFNLIAAIEGNAWLDQDIDDLFDSGEMPLEGWIIEILDMDGMVIGSGLVAADGSYSVGPVPAGMGYTVQLRNPASTAVFGVLENVTLPPGLTVIDQNLPIDPSGVVYDSVSRLPVPGVTVTLVDGGGTPLPAACLLPGQQDQVTGADGLYRFDVIPGADAACPSGGTYDIVFTVPAGFVDGISTTIPPTPGPLVVTGLPDPFQVQPQAVAPTGAASTLYYLSFLLSSGDPNVINNHIPIDPIGPPSNLMVSKRADRRQTVVGDLVRYTVTVENPGAAVSGLTLSDAIPPGFTFVPGSTRSRPATGVTASGQRPVLFSGVDIVAGGSTEVSYLLRVGAGVTQGDYTNTVTPLVGGIAVGNNASATVAVVADPDFEQTTVVGMVFNDANGDGWQDEGEAGIPGVRLATVEGLIIETDAFGRYHLAGIDGGRHDRGRNFIIKVDQASLPDGIEFTTENPRVQRITEGLLNRFDFGVRMPTGAAGCCETIEVKIGEIFFTDGSADVRPEFMPLVQQLADRLRESGGGKLYLEGHAEPSEAIAYTADALTVTQYFTPRSTEIRPEYKRELDALIAKWRGADRVSLSAIGHTCNTRIAPKNRKEFKDNYELSRARAQAVASYVRLGLGIAPEQVSIQGKGPDEPVASNATPEGGALNRRVELTISGQRTERQATSAGDLARDRANAVYELLRRQLGDEYLRNISITTGDATSSNQQEPGMTSTTQPGWLSRSAGALLGLMVGTAHAGMPEACSVDSCRTDEGYVIQILPSSDAPSPNDTRAALADSKRVDLSGQFSVPAGGGMLWATEDPSGAQPRLGLHAPEIAPVKNGTLAMPVSFFIYANYAAFIDRAEIQIYHGDDIDLIEPLATVPFKPGVFSRLDWPGADLGRELAEGDELYYRVRAYDDGGRHDETHLEHLVLVSVDEYKRSAEADPDVLMPFDVRLPDSAAVNSRGPLNGNVLVLQPPAKTGPATRRSYTLTPHFDSRKTALKAADRADLDKIIAEWRGATDLRLHVIGHTDNIRIAPQNRKEFANNQVLSEARAKSVAAYVASRLGMKPAQVSAEGRADSEPVASNKTADGRAENRRVEMNITGVRDEGMADTAVGKKLVEPFSNTIVNIGGTLQEAANLMGARMGEGKFSTSGRRYADAVGAQASSHALEAVYGRSDLRLQRIPVNGSRVRINGQDIAGNMSLRINGDPVPLDKTGKYAVEYLMPVGSHNFDVELVDSNGAVSDRRSVPVQVAGKHIFMVALADFTLSDNNVSGSIEPLAADDRYDDDFLVEGRLAFYLKGKVKGKYLITGQLDTREEEIGDMFSNLFDKDPQSVLRRLDPDRYYPVYGDDSTTISDTDTQGRFYFRADWDRSSATWGNFHTGFTGNEFAQYNRSLYGAHYQHESLNVTARGDAKTEALAFVSEAQTSFGHSEFLGTGGSLYYLKHQDILPGSEKAWIEVRDRDSDRVRELITLQRGVDYEVDEIQGRMILSRPLMQVSRLHAPGLIKDSPLDGDELVLLVDYEYLPLGFSPDKVSLGGRGKHWVTDELAIGGTLVSENRGTEDYSLYGGDVLWQPGEGTYVKAEFASSEASQADRFESSDGGLTFDATTPFAAGRAGDAWGIEGRFNSREMWNTEGELVGGAFYRRTDDNFSVARRDPGVDTIEYGVELTGALSPRADASIRSSVVEHGNVDKERRVSLQGDYELNDRSSLSGELRTVEETRLGDSAEGTLLGLRYSYTLREAVEVYGIGQFTLANDSGRYDNNDLATVGASVQLNDRATVQGEYSSGHRGNGALLNLDYRLDDRHEVYGTFTQSVDSTELREPGTRMALGHRSRITNQATLFNERQFVEDRDQAGIAHVFGLDFNLGAGWSMGISAQNGELETNQGLIDRDAGTVTATYRGPRTNYRGKAEYRNENGVSDVRQLLTTNRLDVKINEDWRLLTRINHSETEDQTLSDRDDNALFTEAGLGFAYRPVANNRLNMLAKYTFLYDLPAPEQIDGGTDQRSHVVSLEGIYRINPRWELGGKLAQRSGELRVDRDFGQWFESTTNFFALRGRYHLIRRWDAMIEYRTLDVDEAGSTRDGWLVSVDRHINDHFRLGLGYNFTDFSDDLTDLDYDHNGWFINAIGKY